MPRSRGIAVWERGGAHDQDGSWRDVRPLHADDVGDDRRVRPMVGHDPRVSSAECPACALSGASPRGAVESPEQRELRLSQGWDEAMNTARENERRAYA